MPTTAEILAMAERLDAWKGFASEGYSIPAAGTAMHEAAAMLRQWALGEYICRCGQRVDSVLSKQEVDF